MVKTASTMLPLGTMAPAFALPDTEGKMVRLSDFEGHPCLVVMFICNHCPFVKHLYEGLRSFGEEMLLRNVAVVAINANDVASHPDDAPARMAEEKQERGYSFSYLFDETQDVAKAYRAACTPDFFVFDKAHQLVYRGQFDESRPGNDHPVTGKDLRRAVDAVLAGQEVPEPHRPSIGCNIKWKPGNAPDYFPRVASSDH
jgi:peroxiredoxin